MIQSESFTEGSILHLTSDSEYDLIPTGDTEMRQG